MLPSLPSPLAAPMRSQNARNTFKRYHNVSRRPTTLPNVCTTFQDAPQRCQPFPNSLMLMLTYIPYHRFCLQYHHAQHKHTIYIYGIGLSTCIKYCMCSSCRQTNSHDTYEFHARSTSGICICHLRWEKTRFYNWVIRVSRALVRCLLLGGGSSHTSKQLPLMLEQNFEKYSSQPMKHVT